MKVKNALRHCPICDAGQVVVLHHQKFILAAGHPLPDAYDVVFCRNCDFAFADTAALQSDYDLYYGQLSKYDDAALSTGGGASALDAARLQETAQGIAAELSTPDAAILDIGCATGGLLNELKQLGFENVRGLDPSPQSRLYAREHFDIGIEIGGIFQRPEMDAFDCVILSHVLEHVRDLREAINAVEVLVKPDGLLYIEVPDATRYSECLVAPFQDFNVEHINHFSPKSLNALMTRCSFAPAPVERKSMQAAPGVPYPALFGFWKKTNQTQVPNHSANELESSLLNYIAQSREMLDAMDARLRKALWDENGAARPAIVWGAGQLTLKLLAETRLGEANVLYFVEGNSVHWGKELQSTPIVSPQQLNEVFNSQPELRNAPIVVGSTIHQDAIIARVQGELMWQNPLVTLR
jgi:SAM-dependent methyltransferase